MIKICAKGRKKPGEMNKLEAEYAGKLDEMQHSGKVAWWKYEAIRLKLADNTTYTPDFFVMLITGDLQVHETKGFWREDAKVKFKIAASIFPFTFFAITKKSRKEGGGWVAEEF